jgi:hypothetical protein
MMGAINFDLADMTRERAKRRAKKHNAAFRRRLEQDKAARKESMKLKLASLAAGLSWAFAGIQLIR